MTWRLPLSTYLVLAFDGVGAPICYWLVPNVPRPDVNNIVLVWKYRMRIPGTAREKIKYLGILTHVYFCMNPLRWARRHWHIKESFASAYRHQSESWSSGRAHWLLSNRA